MTVRVGLRRAPSKGRVFSFAGVLMSTVSGVIHGLSARLLAHDNTSMCVLCGGQLAEGADPSSRYAHEMEVPLARSCKHPPVQLGCVTVAVWAEPFIL